MTDSKNPNTPSSDRPAARDPAEGDLSPRPDNVVAFPPKAPPLISWTPDWGYVCSLSGCIRIEPDKEPRGT